MFFLKKIYCRIFQSLFRLALPILPYREPKVLSSLEGLKDVFNNEKSSSILVVTDKGIVLNKLIEPVEEVLKETGIKYYIYDKTQPNPTTSNVEEALKLYLENKCDTIIAIGGGSALDCAKGVGARAAYPKKALKKMAGVLKVIKKIPTLIAIPTTAGTGSETTLAAVITDSETHHKYPIMSFSLIPHYAILDAKLTYSLPPHLTSTTGMDALTHAVEAFIGRSTTRKTRLLAIDAIKMIFENIEKAYNNGSDYKARKNMLDASYKAGVAFSMSYVGYIHAIAHSLGGKYNIPHGLANAIIMPYVLEQYGKSAYKKLHYLGIITNVCSNDDSYEEGAKKFIEAIRKLNKNMNIPSNIKDIMKDDIKELAKIAEKEANPLYPVPRLMDKTELESCYYLVLGIDNN